MSQTSEDRIVYTPRADATPETEAAALSTICRFLLLEHVHAERGQDDERENHDASAKKHSTGELAGNTRRSSLTEEEGYMTHIPTLSGEERSLTMP
jgi:hypothetical protein